MRVAENRFREDPDMRFHRSTDSPWFARGRRSAIGALTLLAAIGGETARALLAEVVGGNIPTRDLSPEDEPEGRDEPEVVPAEQSDADFAKTLLDAMD